MPSSLIPVAASFALNELTKDDGGAGEANGAAANASNTQARIANEQWQRYKEVYAPLESSMVKEAQNYDSPENYAKAAGEAQATVSSQFGKARERLSRTPGLDPSSPGATASMAGLDLAQAATDATQQNAARQKVKDVAYARKTDAISLGKGLPAMASSALGQSANASLAQAQFQQGQANAQAGASGRIVDRVLNNPSTSNWINNKFGGGSSAQTINPNSGEFLGSLEF